MKNVRNKQRMYKNRRIELSVFILFIFLLFDAGQLQAQIPADLPAVKTGTVNAGSLLTQLMKAIKPSSFTSQWAGEKSNWLSSAGKIVSTPGMIEGITSLTKYIKPSMFKEAFKPANLIQTATNAKSMAEAAGLLKNLEEGLKPEAMVSGWAGKKDSWLSALSMLK